MTTTFWLPAKTDRYSIGRDVVVDTIVFHTTTTTFDGTIATFQGGSRKVSAHYVVDKEQDRIGQCVNERNTAWHCGNWPENQRSVGIEGVDDGDWWGPRPDAFYDREIALVLDIMTRHPITRFLRHEDTTPTACPDGLDTERIIGGVQMPTDYAAIAEKVKQEVRNVLLGEPHLTATALKRFLTQSNAAAPKRTHSKSTVRKGHGKGR